MTIKYNKQITKPKLQKINNYAQQWKQADHYHEYCSLSDSINSYDYRKLSPGQVAQILTNSAKLSRPFSLIRIGDGEGRLISSNYTELDSNLCDFQCQWWFGRTITKYEKQALSQLLDDGIANSDLIGIPGLQSICNEIPEGTSSNQKIPANPMGRILLFRRYGDLLNRKLLTSACIHQSLNQSGWLIPFLQRFKVNGFIGYSNKLATLLKANYGLESFTFFQIPGESQCHGKYETDHYPHIFHTVCNEISKISTFGIYLVAGGVLGKYYCSKIKECGGLAIDIGSVADDWTQEGRFSFKANSQNNQAQGDIEPSEETKPRKLSTKPENLARQSFRKGRLLDKKDRKINQSLLMYQNSLLLHSSEKTLNKRQLSKLLRCIINHPAMQEPRPISKYLLPIIYDVLNHPQSTSNDFKKIKQLHWLDELKFISKEINNPKLK